MKNPEFFIGYYQKPWMRALLHAAFWLVLFAFTFYYNAILPDPFSVTPAKYLGAIRSTLSVMVAYYPLMYWVVPKLILKKRYGLGAAAVLMLIVLYTITDWALEMLMYQTCASCLATLQRTIPEYYEFLQSGVVMVVLSRIASLAIIYQFLAFIAVPAGIKIGIAYFRQKIQTLQLQQQNLQLEFNFLKAQVNPHFLFNTLNNIYGLVLQDQKEQSAETIARLSNFMRYTLYDCNEDKNPAGREIRLLEDYIALEKLRVNEMLVNFTYELDRADYMLPPLLFLPLVENAFKYVAAADDQESWINARLHIIKDSLIFEISNTFQQHTFARKEGGIGINKFTRRLEHYYSGHASKSIINENGVYKITVKINAL